MHPLQADVYSRIRKNSVFNPDGNTEAKHSSKSLVCEKMGWRGRLRTYSRGSMWTDVFGFWYTEADCPPIEPLLGTRSYWNHKRHQLEAYGYNLKSNTFMFTWVWRICNRVISTNAHPILICSGGWRMEIIRDNLQNSPDTRVIGVKIFGHMMASCASGYVNSSILLFCSPSFV
jgi:hypothetical protein